MDDALAQALEALKTTAGNIRSLGAAGAVAQYHGPYQEWLAVVERAIRSMEDNRDG